CTDAYRVRARGTRAAFISPDQHCLRSSAPARRRSVERKESVEKSLWRGRRRGSANVAPRVCGPENGVRPLVRSFYRHSTVVERDSLLGRGIPRVQASKRQRIRRTCTARAGEPIRLEGSRLEEAVNARKLVSTAIVLGPGFAATQATSVIWRAVTGHEPPTEIDDDGQISGAEVVLFAAVSSAAAALVKAFATKGAKRITTPRIPKN